MSERATLVLDFGNSETRLDVKFISKKTGKNVSKRVDLSNKFYEMRMGMTIPANYRPEKTSVIKIEGEYTGYYINGEFVEKEYQKQCIKPIPARPKYSMCTAISFGLAVAKAHKIITEENGEKSADGYILDVVALMPPVYCTESDIDLLDKELRKVKKVSDLYNVNGEKYCLDVEINKVDVYPEGFAAYIGCMYTKEADVRKGYEEFVTAAVLTLDIGAGTTDMVVISDTEVIDNTKETFNIGGHNVRAKLSKLIRNKYKYDKLLDSQLEEAMITGKLQDGGSEFDVADLVMEAKREVAKILVNDITDYLLSIDFSLRTIRGLLVVGGGTLGGTNRAITPISEIIEELLKEFAPNIERVDLPTVQDEDGNLVTISPRELNIEGASILADAA